MGAEPDKIVNVKQTNNEDKALPQILVNDKPPKCTRSGADFPTGCNDIHTVRRALPQFFAVSVKNILLFVFGMTLGFPTIVIPAIQGGEDRESSSIVLNRDQISWFSSINLICVPLGCIFSGALTNKMGKKKAMQLVNLPIITAWLLFHFASRVEHLYAALCLTGLSGGLMEAPVLTYVSEVAQPEFRGVLAASASTCVILGVFVQFVLGSLMDWRTIAAVNIVFSVLSIVSLFFVPETPAWLIKYNRYEEAVKALQWLRGWVPMHKVENEFNELYENIIMKNKEQQDQESEMTKCCRSILLFKNPVFLRPFLLVLFCFFTGHFSGKTTLQTYAVQIFHTLKAPVNKYHATILLGLVELIGTVLCVVLIHFTGRRPLVFFSLIGTGLCYSGTATYAYFLNVVPGFAVTNVVNNASLLLPTDSVINLNNLTKIFEEEKILLENSNKFDNDFITSTIIVNLLETTTISLMSDDPTTMNWFLDTDYNNSTSSSSHVIEKRDALQDSQINYMDLDYQMENTTYDSENTTDEMETFTDEIETSTNNVESATNEMPLQILTEFNAKKSLTDELVVIIPKQQTNKYLWVPLALLLSSALFSHLGIRLIPWLLIGEVFPISIRSTASGVSAGCGYIFGFLANKFFLTMLSTMTMPGTFLFYASVALFGAVVLYFALPETEGRTLNEIEEHFAGVKSLNKHVKSDAINEPIDLEMEDTGPKNNKSFAESYNASKGVSRKLGIPNEGFTGEERSSTHL